MEVHLRPKTWAAGAGGRFLPGAPALWSPRPCVPAAGWHPREQPACPQSSRGRHCVIQKPSWRCLCTALPAHEQQPHRLPRLPRPSLEEPYPSQDKLRLPPPWIQAKGGRKIRLARQKLQSSEAESSRLLLSLLIDSRIMFTFIPITSQIRLTKNEP